MLFLPRFSFFSTRDSDYSKISVGVFWDKAVWSTSHTHSCAYSNLSLVGNRTCAGRLILVWYPTSRCGLRDKCGLHRTTRNKDQKEKSSPFDFLQKLKYKKKINKTTSNKNAHEKYLWLRIRFYFLIAFMFFFDQTIILISFHF